jgi:hypothetical protein
MSENLDKSHVDEAGEAEAAASEQGLEGALECSDETLQKKVKSDSPSSQRVGRPHCKQI